MRTIFSEGRPVAGRATWGARTAAQVALEDKNAIARVWDACGVPRAASSVVPLDAAPVRDAFASHDGGAGVVVAGDNRSGWHGGAAFTRWARTADEAVAVAADYATACDSARVMPFVEGVPCSIHGIVFDDDVAALRPCEMLVLRCEDGTFHYAGVATAWDPRDDDRKIMRATARRVGAHLRDTVDYRGVFTIDGVMGSDGFRPTELNPRFGAAMGGYASALRDVPLYLMHLAIVERVPIDWQPERIEALLVGAADAERHVIPTFSDPAGALTCLATPWLRCEVAEYVEYSAPPRLARRPPFGVIIACVSLIVGIRVFTMVDRAPDTPVSERVRANGRGFDVLPDGEANDAWLHYGPAAFGGYASMVCEDRGIEREPAFGPRAATTLAWMDAHLGLGLGSRGAARDVRG